MGFTQNLGEVGFGVAAFDQWDSEFWDDQKAIYLKDPANKAKDNNCKVMDPVRPM